jgi:hypothetical protein
MSYFELTFVFGRTIFFFLLVFLTVLEASVKKVD